MSDAETLKVYAEKVDDYAKLVTRGTPDRDLQDFIDGVPAGSRVLDLGCGPGNSAAMMMDAGLEVEATDASPEMIALAIEAGVAAELARFEDVDTIGRFSGIWANFSLLHAPKLEMPVHLARIAAALLPGGLLHLGLKTGTGEKRDHLGRFYAYYSEEELRDLLSAAGFEVSYVRHGSAPGLAGSNDPFIIMKARLA
jgi:predicted TPR repeat methyltransferase